MNAVFLADLHAHTWKQFARIGPGGANSRLGHLAGVLRQVWAECKRRGVRDVFVAGDLVHVKRHVPVQAITVLYDALAEARGMGLEVSVISGNHDQVEDDELANTPRIFRDVAEVHHAPGVDAKRRIVYVPWQFDQARVGKFLKELRGEWELLLYHGEVRGAFVGPTDYPVALKSQVRLEDLCPGKFRWIMMGHLHRRQMVSERCYYAGNPLPKDRGEPETDKGALFLDGDELEIFATRHPRFVTVDLSEGYKVGRGENLALGDALAAEIPKMTRGNFLYLVVPAKTDDAVVAKLLEKLDPLEAEWQRAPGTRDPATRRETSLRLGQTLEEMFDRYVDEEAEGDPARKAFGRKLLEDSPEEGASH